MNMSSFKKKNQICFENLKKKKIWFVKIKSIFLKDKKKKF